MERNLPLLNTSPPQWAPYIVANFHEFLQDHAACERKAASLAMSFVIKYPDRRAVVEPMVSLAREELEHFMQVYRLMQNLGVELSPKDSKDPYVNATLQQLRHGRDERFLDRLVMSALIEARGYERFALLAAEFTEGELKKFYRTLSLREAGHYKIFINVAAHYFSQQAVEEAISRLAQVEAEAMISMPIAATLH